MSTLKVQVVELDIEDHPKADRLDVAKPRGMAWQCVTAKGTYKSGDKAIYIPIDSVLPDELVKKLGIENFYSKKIRTIKLRGLVSQGMIAPLNILIDKDTKGLSDNECQVIFGGLKELPIGEDVTSILNITKWDPPIPIQMAGKIRKHDSRFCKYTDIENYKNYPDVFKEGELVVLTEKIHGTNGRAANIEGDIHVGSHNMDLIDDENNLYWRAARILEVKEKLSLGEQVFFEVYGHSIQDLGYGGKPGEVHVGIFDFMRNGIYVDHEEFIKALEERGWKNYAVPILTMPKWSAGCIALAEGPSTIDGGIREGFVIKPLKEDYSVELQGRKVLKVIGDRYHLRKGGTERH